MDDIGEPDFEILGNDSEKLKDKCEDVDDVSDSSAEEEDLLLADGEIDEDDDDDDAPEAVSFTKGKETAMSKLQGALVHVRNKKEKDKLKRRNLHEKYKQQKKEKIQALEKRRLPADFFEGLEPSQTLEIKKNKIIDESLQEESAKRTNVEDEEDKFTGALSGDDSRDGDDGFIPLSSEKIKPVVLKSVKKSSAQNFKQNMLNRKSVKRESTKTRFMKEKNKAAFKSVSRNINPVKK